jgi:hypothetical protein
MLQISPERFLRFVFAAPSNNFVSSAGSETDVFMKGFAIELNKHSINLFTFDFSKFSNTNDAR